jgi:protein O-GlcNAc transferase
MDTTEPSPSPVAGLRRKVLHVGCGHAPLPASLPAAVWDEVRYDIDPAVRPHVVGSMTDMGVLADASMDALYSSHNVEHLEAHEVAIALGEFFRVLKPGGTAWIVVPDLQCLAERIAAGDVEGELYVSASGPISVSDMLWGHRASLAAGQHYMAHRCGFTAASLERKLSDAGFGPVRVERQLRRRELMAIATRPRTAPADLDALFEQARQLHADGRWADALPLYTAVAQGRPRFGPAQLELGAVRCLNGELDRAIEHLQRAIALQPGSAHSHQVLGQCYALAGRPAEALDSLQRALKLDPASAAAHFELGRVCQERQQWAAADTAFRKTLRLAPDHRDAAVQLARVVAEQGRLGAALTLAGKALADAADPRLLSTMLPLLAAAEGTTDGLLAGALQDFDRRFAAPLAAAASPHDRAADPQRCLRVAYLSPHFLRHPLQHRLLPVLAQHDRTQVELWCYHDAPRAEDVSAAYRALADRWVVCHGLGDAALAERIRADGIDVLVDCTGHGDAQRLQVVARRPAPVQVSLWGAPAGPLLDAFDARISDRWLEPEDRPAGAAGVPLRLASGCFAWTPPLASPAVGDPPFERFGAVTFGVVAPGHRLQMRAIQAWAAVLRQLDGARLCMQSAALQQPRVRQGVAAAFARLGVDADRLRLRAWADGSSDLDGWQDIDVLLDTLPAPGLSTTCEALWMAVPVVTLAGTRPSARVGASLLHAAGLGDWVAADEADYVARAVALARDTDQLRTWRRTLRDRLLASPLLDATVHARELEAGYRSVWQRWCAGATTN